MSLAKGVPDITNGGVFKNPAFSSLTVNSGQVTVNYIEKPMSSDELKNEFMDISSGKPIVSTNTYAANSSFIDNPSPEKSWSNFDISVIPNDGDKNQAIIKTYDDTGDKSKRIYVGSTPDEKIAMLNLLKLASNSPIGFDQSKFSNDYNTAIKSGKPNVQMDAQNNTFVAFANGSTMTMNPRVGAEIFVPRKPMTFQHIDPDTAQYKELEKSLRSWE